MKDNLRFSFNVRYRNKSDFWLRQNRALLPFPSTYGWLDFVANWSECCIVVFMNLVDRYFKPKPFESEDLYRKLGVFAFNKYINPNSTTNSFKLSQAYRKYRSPGGNFGGLPSSGTRLERIRTFEKNSKRNEVTHLGGLAMNAAVELALQAKNGPRWARVANGVFALIGNTYPILVQRNNRLRTTRILERLEAREQVAFTETSEIHVLKEVPTIGEIDLPPDPPLIENQD